MDTGLREHDVVALTADLTQERLLRGQVGTIVHVHPDGSYLVEFSGPDGRAYALTPVRPDQVMLLRHSPSKVA